MNSGHSYALLTRLDLNLLQVFSIIYQERNLTRAAERLCVSPSAVSHGLRRLREVLDDPLFQREAHGVTPTPLAQRIWPDVQKGLAHLQNALTLSECFDPRRDVHRITLAMNDELEPVLLPLLQQLIHDHAPNARTESVRVSRPTLRSDLAAGRIDCAIDVKITSTDGLSSELIAREGWVVVSRASIVLDPASYATARHITVSSRRTGLAVEDYVLAQQGIERDVMVRCQSYEAAFRLVAKSDLLLTMPRSLAMSINSYLELHLLEVPYSLPEIGLYLYWSTERTADLANAWLRDLLLGGQLRGIDVN